MVNRLLCGALELNDKDPYMVGREQRKMVNYPCIGSDERIGNNLR